jgi:hypothetical protein
VVGAGSAAHSLRASSPEKDGRPRLLAVALDCYLYRSSGRVRCAEAPRDRQGSSSFSSSDLKLATPSTCGSPRSL